MPKKPWDNPCDAPPIEQSIHDYVVSIFRMQPSMARKVPIIPISPGAEAKRGWDAAVLEAVPLYFQYKLPDFTGRPHSSQPLAFSRRQNWRFDDSEGLFHFHLRAKAKGEPRCQHELLVDMSNNGERVYYVSPTFIDKHRLRCGGELMPGNSAWIWGHVSFSNWIVMERYNVPYFQGLICIPPHMDVTAPPESHCFFFNSHHEVTLHSDPVLVEAKSLDEVVKEQISLLEDKEAINLGNVDAYVQKILLLISRGGEDEDVRESVIQYYEQRLRRQMQTNTDGSDLMAKLRVLARVVNTLTGMQLMLTIRRMVF